MGNRLQKLASPSGAYREATAQYRFPDFMLAVFSLLLGGCIMAGMAGLVRRTPDSITNISVVYNVFVLPLFLLCIAGACRLQKKPMLTFGFGSGHILAAILAGLAVVAVLFSIRMAYLHFALGVRLRWNPDRTLRTLVFGLLFTVFQEEFLFRGFISTRFYGFMKNKPLAVVLVGVLFALFHVPYLAAVRETSYLQELARNWYFYLSTALFHCYMHMVYAKTNNIAAPVVMHLAWNVATTLVA